MTEIASGTACAVSARRRAVTMISPLRPAEIGGSVATAS
jgi:hypothetical protein